MRAYSAIPGLITHKVWLHDPIAPSVYLKENGYKEWWLNNLLHREDGPAIEHINGDREYYLNGTRHRTDGPAIIFKNKTYFEYWVDGKQLTEQEFKHNYPV